MLDLEQQGGPRLARGGAICTTRGLVPRYGPYGVYTISVTVTDNVRNSTRYTGAELGTASISNTP